MPIKISTKGQEVANYQYEKLSGREGQGRNLITVHRDAVMGLYFPAGNESLTKPKPSPQLPTSWRMLGKWTADRESDSHLQTCTTGLCFLSTGPYSKPRYRAAQICRSQCLGLNQKEQSDNNGDREVHGCCCAISSIDTISM